MRSEDDEEYVVRGLLVVASGTGHVGKMGNTKKEHWTREHDEHRRGEDASEAIIH